MHRACSVGPWVLALVLSACTAAEGPAPSASAEPAAREVVAPAQGAPPTAVDAQQWACTKDAECSQTCALGAVSKAWLADHRDLDTCDDGCGWRSGSIACRDGECVTLTDDGDIDENCTKRTTPMYR